MRLPRCFYGRPRWVVEAVLGAALILGAELVVLGLVWPEAIRSILQVLLEGLHLQ